MPNLLLTNKSWFITDHARRRLWERFGIYVGADDLDWSKKPTITLCTGVTMPGQDRKTCNHYLTCVGDHYIVVLVGRKLSKKDESTKVITVMPPDYYATQSWAVALSDPLQKLKDMVAIQNPDVWKEFLKTCPRSVRGMSVEDIAGPTLSLDLFKIIGWHAHPILEQLLQDAKQVHAYLGHERAEMMKQNLTFIRNNFRKWKAYQSEPPETSVFHTELSTYLSEMSEQDLLSVVIRGGAKCETVSLDDRVFQYEGEWSYFEASEDFRALQILQSYLHQKDLVDSLVSGHCA